MYNLQQTPKLSFRVVPLTFLPVMNESFCCSTSLSAFVIVRFLKIFLTFLIIVQWHLIVVLNCFPVMTNDVKASFHEFICHPCIFWVPQCLFKYFSPFGGLLILLLLSFENHFYILVIILHQIWDLQIVSPHLWLVFIFLMVSIREQKFLILMRFSLSIFPFMGIFFLTRC